MIGFNELERQIKAEDPGSRIRDQKRAEELLNRADAERWESAKKDLDAEKDYIRNPCVDTYNAKKEASRDFEEKGEAYYNIKTAMNTGEIYYGGLPTQKGNNIANAGEIDLATIYNVRCDIDGDPEHITVENYSDDSTSGTPGEGESIPIRDLTDHISVIDTRETLKKIAGILGINETLLEDDKDSLYEAVDSVQEKHAINTETKLLCNLAKNSKPAVALTIDTFSATVNGSLCAKAKRGAEIITNEDGFNKLDVYDSHGNPLVKKDFTTGEFVFMDKYIIRNVSNNTLANNEDGSSPVLVGDWRNIFRLAILKKLPPLVKDDILNESIEFRAIKKVIPILTTTSDKAFIVGSMA